MNEIEEKFMTTFNIKPQDYYACDWDSYCPYTELKQCGDTCPYWKKYKTDYPPITDRILLELICILNDFEGIDIKSTTVEELKEELLKQCIEPFEYPIAFEEHHEIDKLYNQVQSLFTEKKKKSNK